MGNHSKKEERKASDPTVLIQAPISFLKINKGFFSLIFLFSIRVFMYLLFLG